MKLAFASLGCPNWSIEQVAAQAAALGFDGVELRGIQGEHLGPAESPAELQRIRKLFKDSGTSILAIMGYSTFMLPDGEKREELIHTALQFIATAQALGCPVLRVFGGQTPEGLSRAQAIENVVNGLRRLAGPAEAAGVSVAIETHDDWCRGEFLAQVLDAVGSPAIGACWDAANSHFIEPVATTYQAISAYIKHVHFKDSQRGADGKIHSVLPGTGEVPLEQILTLLRDGNYQGTLSFEWEKKWQPELQEPEIAFPHYLKVTTGLMKKLGIPRG